MASLKVLLGHSSGGTKENYENLQPIQSVSRSSLEPDIPQIQVRKFTG
jgi:hypothetical protein